LKAMRRGFSVEMDSKRYVKSISISNEAHERVLFEGDIGEILELAMVDGEVLEVKGANGTLRIDISEKELRMMLDRPAGAA
jgi:hypothetical protein